MAVCEMRLQIRMFDLHRARDELAHSITSSARASSEGGTSRPSAFAVLIADWSGLVDLVDGNDGKRAGPTRIVHAGHGIDGLTDLCDGKTVAWRDHAGST